MLCFLTTPYFDYYFYILKQYLQFFFIILLTIASRLKHDWRYLYPSIKVITLVIAKSSKRFRTHNTSSSFEKLVPHILTTNIIHTSKTYLKIILFLYYKWNVFVVKIAEINQISRYTFMEIDFNFKVTVLTSYRVDSVSGG